MTGTTKPLSSSITNSLLPLRFFLSFLLPLLLVVVITIIPSTNSLSSSPTKRQPPKQFTQTINPTTNPNPPSSSSLATFLSPLLSAGYPPTVHYSDHLSQSNDNSSQSKKQKPLLLYLPGFDGTILSPFLQFPELSTIFDIRAMKVPMEDRSTFLDLRRVVVDYLREEEERRRRDMMTTTTTTTTREVYLMGESFGGVLACDIMSHYPITGLVLINPATSYPRSNLRRLSPTVLAAPPFLYPFRLLSTLLPLFIDEYQMPQLGLILSSQALPSVIDSREREAYMGRVAFSLPFELKFMPRETLAWRLEEWLSEGCDVVGVETLECLKERGGGRVLVVVGEDDRTLPSVEEGERIRSFLGEDRCVVTVVPGAGHASTCGSRVDLAAEMRRVFPALRREEGGRMEMKVEAREGKGAFYGMEGRYDGSTTVGLSPFKYWDDDLYIKCDG